MGPDFLIEVRYSQIIASFFILMIYSSGMPLLYFIGFLQFFVMYWVDKILCKSLIVIIADYCIVLRFYKTPPRYGIELSDISRNIMQYAILLHMLFGFYMYSNSQILTVDANLGSMVNSAMSSVSGKIDGYLSDNSYISITRVT